MWFGNAVNTFNIQVAQMGKSGPNVQANLSNGFTSRYLQLHGALFLKLLSLVLWVGYAFGAVPLICVLMKIHHATTPAEAEKS